MRFKTPNHAALEWILSAALGLALLTGCTATLHPATTPEGLEALTSQNGAEQGFLALTLVASIDKDGGHPSLDLGLIDETSGKPVQISLDTDELAAVATGKPRALLTRLPAGHYRFDIANVNYAGMYHGGLKFPPSTKSYPLGAKLAKADIQPGRILHAGTLTVKIGVHFHGADLIQMTESVAAHAGKPEPAAWQSYAPLLRKYPSFYQNKNAVVPWTTAGASEASAF